MEILLGSNSFGDDYETPRLRRKNYKCQLLKDVGPIEVFLRSSKNYASRNYPNSASKNQT